MKWASGLRSVSVNSDSMASMVVKENRQRLKSGLVSIKGEIDKFAYGMLRAYSRMGIPQGAMVFIDMYMMAGWLSSKGKNWGPLAPGHSYTGNGNKDKFAGLWTANGGNHKLEMLVVLAREKGYSWNDIMLFLYVLPNLSPEPATAMDEISQRHDREVPGELYISKGSDYDLQQWRAGIHVFEGLLDPVTWWRNPLDTLGNGSIAFITIGIDMLERAVGWPVIHAIDQK